MSIPYDTFLPKGTKIKRVADTWMSLQYGLEVGRIVTLSAHLGVSQDSLHLEEYPNMPQPWSRSAFDLVEIGKTKPQLTGFARFMQKEI